MRARKRERERERERERARERKECLDAEKMKEIENLENETSEFFFFFLEGLG